MAASTAILSLSMTASMSNEIEAERERLALLNRNITKEDLEQEYEFRRKKMQEITEVFEEIRRKLAASTVPQEEGTVVKSVLNDLLTATNEFEKRLISEAGNALKNNNKPLETAQRYHQAVGDAVNVDKTLAEKTQSVTAFRNYARNGKYSVTQKCIIGGVIGALVSSSMFFGILGAVGAISLLGGPIGIAAYMSIVLVCCIGIGVITGIRIGLGASRNQDDCATRAQRRLQTAITVN